jgi:hypothetical protein
MFTRKTQGRLAAVGGLRVTLIVFGVMWGWHVSAVKAQEVATGSSRVASASEIPSFQRHVAALLGKLGCNGGTCHGAVKGRNGFQLSMFSADPSGDHERITRESAGRRINLVEPRQSLLLLKATGQVPHGGGRRLTVGSPDYQLLLDWLSAHAPLDEAQPSALKRLLVEPASSVIAPGESFSLRVSAEFADGTTEDVTRFCSFDSLDRSVAVVNSTGQVTAEGVGDAGLVVRYRAQPAAARVLIPRAEAPSSSGIFAHHFVDSHVLSKLQQLRLAPAPLCDDATFLRRVLLDVTGQLPTAEEVREFLNDPSPEKRAQVIERLLAMPAHADLWAMRFCDILKAADFGVYADALSKEHDAPRMQAWLRARLMENTPYDQLVERILLATSREGRSMEEYSVEVRRLFEGYAAGRPDLSLYAQRRTLDLYWQRRGSDGVGGAMQVAHAFLGLRLECAQCHRHPHDVWQQDDLLDFANFFMRVRKVGFQGDNEKKFADAAVFFKQFNEEGKTLEAQVKARKEGDGKKLEEEGKKAKADGDKLAAEITKLEKAKAPEEELAEKRRALESFRETQRRADKYREETNDLERRAKALPEVARRLMQAECRLVDDSPPAKVSSTLGTRESKRFRLLGAAEPVEVGVSDDPRQSVVAWMRSPDNPYFARAIVNRVWAHYFGRGIIDPPDNLSAFNPATHPELLDQLCQGFIANAYDLRWLHRVILTSRTYQQSSTPAAGSEADRTHYAAFPLRRLPAEVLVDALNTATGTTENMDMKYHHWPESMTTVQVPFAPRNPFVAYMLETYGRPPRNAAVQCDCERDANGSVFHVLTLANHPRVWEKIKDPGGRVAKLIRDERALADKVDELFLATVSRFPSEEERSACVAFLTNSQEAESGSSSEKATAEKGTADKASAEKQLAEGAMAGAWYGILWSLLNTREFLLQH